MYYTYKQCYSLGIQEPSTDTCIDTGVQLGNMMMQETNSEALAIGMGKVCAIACEGAHHNIGIPSYSSFASDICE